MVEPGEISQSFFPSVLLDLCSCNDSIMRIAVGSEFNYLNLLASRPPPILLLTYHHQVLLVVHLKQHTIKLFVFQVVLELTTEAFCIVLSIWLIVLVRLLLHDL